MNRTKLLKLYLLIMGIFLLLWWPLSHWFYPDWYHNLLGFSSYDDSFVKIIGTAGLVPVLCLFFSASNPVRNRDMITILIIFCLAMAATYIFLIHAQGFPAREYLNVTLSIISAALLTYLYPRASKENR